MKPMPRGSEGVDYLNNSSGDVDPFGGFHPVPIKVNLTVTDPCSLCPLSSTAAQSTSSQHPLLTCFR